MKKSTIAPLAVLAGLLLMTAGAQADEPVTGTSPEDVQAVLKASFEPKGIAKLDRLEQSPMQKACSQADLTGKPLSKEDAAMIAKEALASIKYPAEGQFLGDWKAGEKVAQNGRGLQFSDKEGAVNGGNCYACHQMTKAEISFGNIGPSLLHYGKQRGSSKEIMEYTWAKIYDSHAYAACSAMPRFGAAGILTEAQLKDVMALLFDPESPVNKDDVAQ
ncbi:sulfur oxidation c-type cytochrome SoxX [Allopusillimonas ginsengisoli]|uniref:sulfur oxidation c-type cytochrome SoxX n=1 Tax=Allopusillimonas ginsengisoli TaxID=453575 RepID=UPI00101F0EEC|nr:sulfur oxidation c-type cytochrome SoxX [Allopusillimonas ginsengisoli]TEA77128.1 sulfur oxidation c-type cytochrome SoxX [Allopusillimonas ginsengisoli]